jgi:hypothetical protein
MIIALGAFWMKLAVIVVFPILGPAASLSSVGMRSDTTPDAVEFRQEITGGRFAYQSADG